MGEGDRINAPKGPPIPRTVAWGEAGQSGFKTKEPSEPRGDRSTPEDAEAIAPEEIEEEAPWSQAGLAGARTMVAGGEVLASLEGAEGEEALPWPNLGRLELVRLLGVGGMGRVYEARDPTLGRNVAVKVIHDEIAADEIWRTQFIDEAMVTAQLEHPNIVPLYDVGTTEDGACYLVMRKVEGRSLGDVLEALDAGDETTEQEWGRHRLLSTFLKVCQAVAYAHAHGVLHRDLKPPNIMLGAYGEVLVLDWGVARRIGQGTGPDGARQSSEQGSLVGTPGYMSPEQAQGRVAELDARSDVWSLGAVLYELLTHEPAYRGERPTELLLNTLSGMPTLPPRRAPRLEIPGEIAEICMKAMATDRNDRYQSASELARAVETFLEGTRRRAQAAERLERASEAWSRYVGLGRERTRLRSTEKRFADAADAWAPLSEKEELVRTRDELAELELRRARAFGEVVALCEKALGYDPDNPGARAKLADAYWERLQEAEEQRNTADVAYYTDRVAAYDVGSYELLLEGTGALSLDTDPPGAEVICERYEPRGLVYPLVERRVLGRTPLDRVPLAMGSYLMTLRYPGRRDTRYPVFISRCRHWESGPEPILLLADESVGDDMVYVPAGPFVCGGDPGAPGAQERSEPWVDGVLLARFPVTMDQYLQFLNALHEEDPAEAWRRSPRSESSLSDREGQYLERPGRGGSYELPDVDSDGNRWDPTWPVFGVSWHDAVAYTHWLSRGAAEPYRLPTEREFEKAARGVDGRFYPWGNSFDRTLCKMGDSRRVRSRPEPVGVFKADCSPYGVRDVAGSMRDWCGDGSFDDDATLRPVRGGSWNYDPRFCRVACRLGRPPWRIFAYNGFRVARSLPASP